MTAAVVATLTLCNCIISIDAGSSSEEKKLMELEKSRIKGSINQSQYNTKKNDLMKTVDP